MKWKRTECMIGDDVLGASERLGNTPRNTTQWTPYPRIYQNRQGAYVLSQSHCSAPCKKKLTINLLKITKEKWSLACSIRGSGHMGAKKVYERAWTLCCISGRCSRRRAACTLPLGCLCRVGESDESKRRK